MILVQNRPDPDQVYLAANSDGVSERAYPEWIVGIFDDPFDGDEVVHDRPDRDVKCRTCPTELSEINQVHFLGYPLTMCFQCCMVLLHLGGAGLETRVHISLDLLRKLRDLELLDDLSGEPVQAPRERDDRP